MHVRGTLLLAAILLTAAVLFHAADNNPKLPPPYATKSANNRARVIPQPNGAKLNVPAGFKADVWAEDFDVPRFMMLGPNKEVLLTDSGSGNAPNGVVYVLTNNGKDRKKIIEGLNRPFGLEMRNGNIYVAECDSVKRYPYDAKAMTAGKGAEIISLKGQGTHHWTRNLLIDKAGKKIYVGVGSGSNSSPGEDPRRAAINEYNLDGSGHKVYASGTRNPTGIHYYPGTEVLWTSVQERDDLGDDLVPDYFTHVQEGGFYGWPYSYIGSNVDPTNKDAITGLIKDLVAKAIVPDVLLGAHVAVLDFHFYTGKQFPAEYQGGAFLCLHGSWNRSKRVGQSIAFIPFKNGKPSGPMKEVLTGWMLGPDERDVWGRPVGLLELPDGSMLISEDGNKKIWHLSYGK